MLQKINRQFFFCASRFHSMNAHTAAVLLSSKLEAFISRVELGLMCFRPSLKHISAFSKRMAGGR
jgi:hypothetical protein